MPKPSRNAEVLASFVGYCMANPSERFWQALRNWAGAGNFIYASDKFLEDRQVSDTFHWEGKNS